MATSAQLKDLDERLERLADRAHLARAADSALSRLDNLLPVAAIPTKVFAYEKRWIPNRVRQPIRLDQKKTPYSDGVMDAMDTPGVRIVALKGPARFSKTIAAETKALKNWTYGPLVNMLWLMQSKDDLNDYIDERVEWMLDHHPQVSEKINWNDPRNGRSSMRIGGALALWRAATLRALRGKAAPFIVCDEIDAYAKNVRKALKTLVTARQLEFGSNSLAYFCSHPDAGPTEGIDDIIRMGMKHMWWWSCPDCRKSSSPAVGAEHRMTWNVPKLLEHREEMEDMALIDMIEEKARLICPHCSCPVDEAMRLEMSGGGIWLQPHQKLHDTGEVEGEAKIARTMGFEGHAFMAPFASLGELARGWSEAWLKFANTQDDVDLKEQTVKYLGETYGGAKKSQQIPDFKVVKARLAAPYTIGTVPDGVVFLTAFVDVQGDRFEVVVIGWDHQMRSWLIDRFPIKQWPGFETIDPASRVKDWEILEPAVINQRYLIASSLTQDRPMYLPIAKTMINAAGGAAEEGSGATGVTTTARKWMRNALAEGRIQMWQATLFQGSASKTSEPYGSPRPVEFDEAGQKGSVQVYERTLNVHKIKSVIAMRLAVENVAAAGRMFLPFQIKDRYVRELVAEKFVNDAWVATGRNETWDGWVACEAARFILDPHRPELWNKKNPVTGEPIIPVWARPLPKSAPIETVVTIDAKRQMDYFKRLADLHGSS